MLRFGDGQIDALRGAAMAGFREQAVGHVRRHFPNHARVAGDAALGAVVDAALARGLRLGMLSRRAALLHLTVTMMLGSAFDESPAFRWAARILAQDRRPVDNASDLAKEALAWQERMAGAQNRALNRAFLTLARILDDLAPGGQASWFADGPARGLEALHPERCAALGPEIMARLDDEARARAERHGFEGPAGPALIAVAMLFIGWDFEREPFTPWAAAALEGDTGESRHAALHVGAKDFLGAWLAHARPEA